MTDRRFTGAFVDTNVLIRHVTGDPPEQARRATEFLALADGLWLADLIVAEVVYVLESVYQVDRSGIAGLMRSIVSSDRLRVSDMPLLLRAIEVYERHRLAFADAYLVASAERSGVRAVVSFDRGISRSERFSALSLSRHDEVVGPPAVEQNLPAWTWHTRSRRQAAGPDPPPTHIR